jgi:Phospholipase_D-nuclease N-terminal
MDVLTLAIVVAVGALVLGVVVYVVVQITRAPELNQTEKAVWILAFVFFPLVASLVWFLAGPHPLGLRIDRPLR